MDNPDHRELIWQVVHRIPRGTVATYGQIARLAGLPGHARYVGLVLKSLPKGTRLPWHRVINAQGRLSFKPDSHQHQRQQALLEAEGVIFIRGRCSLSRFRWSKENEPSPGKA
ncbi:MAG: methylated-DNA-protein-cysteine methyltransferase [Pseudomonadota bacterium]|jgi:methylated-DNA-protein-cysteine methyltransferase-like protein